MVWCKEEKNVRKEKESKERKEEEKGDILCLNE